MIIVWGRVVARPECLREVMHLSLEHVHRSRKEPGCLCHSVHIDMENPNALVFYEQWQDMEVLQAHFQVPESAQFVAGLTDLVEGEPEIKVYKATPAQ